MVILFAVIALHSTLHSISQSPPGSNTTPESKPDTPTPITKDPVAALAAEWDATGKLDWSVVKLLAQLSKRTYDPLETANDAAIELGFDSGQPVSHKNQVAWVCRRGDIAVVAFRGTDMTEIRDWICDASFATIGVTGGDMHHGFHSGWHGLKDEVERALGDNRPKHIWLTGHSLGGGLAVACAHDWEFADGPKVDGVVTFGQPCIVKLNLAQHWVQSIRPRMLRVVNEDDLVPHLPPGYIYFGGLAWFKKGKVQRTKWEPGVFGAEKDEPVLEEDHGPAPLTQEEFDELREHLIEARRAEAANGEEKLYGDLPTYLGRHWMGDYLLQIELQLESAHSKPLDSGNAASKN